ncbi:nuclear transport factor 2 family protein [Streptomyces lunaelactis]|uniref:nuclear transport factor 2 family protein n=1 Tax=Streptomyces lunaelactis TaxID=1535768 RepID=UPI001584CBA5|nr:nuclear transport factor 2 family protein [Streptomyces lunaelactis]NUK01802.1 nuclear transport factor 2 family protein [Streptomyces lunaelactis]NUK09554.1 nuclear transport factor 2 family protein [Streptomyces lunaelactis]NUK14962.1 nuclear transport factor 2 family protein [Streptomyces lunaelactis]NUK35230.1 nuclear transport factor 2 family protein [Streptomyces lunaelactis]NUK42289.1 nuclear transport factor 2 family protein [Streptomyces lunaelactis]
MTQRVDLATVMDRLTIDELITSYAVAVDDADWSAYRALFTQEGRADYRSSGGVEGPAAEVADWMAETMRLFPVRQHLIVNRRLHIQDLGGYPGDRAEVQADYVNPMRLESGDDFVSGGRYTFSLLRTDAGWRLRTVVIHEKWRRGAWAGGPSGD